MQKEEKVRGCFDFDPSSPKTLPAAVRRGRLLSYLHLSVIGMYLCHLQIGITVEKLNLIGGRDLLKLWLSPLWGLYQDASVKGCKQSSFVACFL